MAGDLLSHAMKGALRAAPASASGWREVLVLGAGGALGSALLAELLGGGGFRRVHALVEGPLASAVRGFEPWPRARLEQARPEAPPGLDTACLVFERARHSNGRDEAFTAPAPDALVHWARGLRAAGVARLLVVVPHAPSMLPGALKGGFADEAERVTATLGFEHLLILRPAQAGDVVQGGPWIERVARLWLSQLRYMVPQREQPVRAVKLAALVATLARLLPEAAAGTRVVPPELLWEAARAPEPQPVLLRWLTADPAAAGAAS